MKYLLLVLLSFQLSAELDLTIPEQPAVYIPPETFFLNLGDYNEPPTKAQKITFWTLNVLDIYTTHQGLKKPYVSEVNPLLGKDPSLEKLILHKIVFASLISKHSSKRYIRGVNVILTMAVVNNYKFVK